MIELTKGATTEGQQKQIINQVKKHGGYSIFWITENDKRAKIATDMVKNGMIVQVDGQDYPWCPMAVKDNKVRQ